MRTSIPLLLAIACALLPDTMTAQEVTGTLIGTVHDAQGGALRGADVRVGSPALIGGRQTASTNEKGQLRVPGAASRTVRPGRRNAGIRGVSRGGHSHRRRRDDRTNRRSPVGGHCRVGRRPGFAYRSARERIRNPLRPRGSPARSRYGDSACSTSSGPLLVCRRLRREASRRTACRRSARAPTRTHSSSTARTSPVRAAARRDPSRASTSSRKCTCSPSGHPPSSATCRAR